MCYYYASQSLIKGFSQVLEVHLRVITIIRKAAKAPMPEIGLPSLTDYDVRQSSMTSHTVRYAIITY